jgi:Tol biopolymer transport system component
MIWTMHADGSNEQELTHAPALDADPDFSPDGSFIAFDQTPLRRDQPPGCQGTCVSLQLMHSDGSDLIGIRREDLAGAVSHPAFSPDGRAMAYVDCVRPFGCRVAASAFDLLRRRPLRRALTVEVPRDSFSSDLMPAWQPLPRAPG